jgi:hypothetical protein
MIFSLIVILLLAAIAYFHYTQGLFSAAISAICAVLAAVLAFSYHETVIFSLLRGKVADYAHGMILIALFALIYTVLRVIFDTLIPGNLRIPTLIDRVGAAVMGLIAGIFALGIFAIAAQSLPFGPSIAGYTRYKTQSQVDVQVPTQRQAEDTYAFDVIGSDTPGKYEESDHSGLLVPVDDMVVSLVSKLSSGALAGERTLASVHPAYVDELFSQRLGVQVGANRVAINTRELQQVSVPKLFTLDQIAQADSDVGDIRKGAPLKLSGDVLKPLPDQMILIVRTMFGRGADDSDHNVRFSPASIRLVAGGKNYHPVGTLDLREGQQAMRANRMDDFVVVGSERGVDLVFVVDREDLGVPQASKKPDAAAGEAKIKDGVFLEVKRMGVVDLGGKTITPGVEPAENVGPVRKKSLPAPKGAASVQQHALPASEQLLVDAKAEVSDKLFTEINVGSWEENSELTFGSGKANLKDKKFVKLTVEPTQTLALLKQGEYTTAQFFVPPGMKMVQVNAKPPPQAPPDPWSWADQLSSFELVDATGNQKFKPNGAWAKLSAAGGQQKMVGQYDSAAPVASITPGEGRPLDVWLAFLVPENTKLKELQFKGKPLQAVDLEVK